MPSLSSALTDRMNYLTAREGVIAGNIANANTPGYLARDLNFKAYLGASAGATEPTRTNPLHLAGTSGGATLAGTTSAAFLQHNGNAVRLDQEMLKQQQNQLDYRYMTQIYAKQAQMQKIALGKAN